MAVSKPTTLTAAQRETRKATLRQQQRENDFVNIPADLTGRLLNPIPGLSPYEKDLGLPLSGAADVVSNTANSIGQANKVAGDLAVALYRDTISGNPGEFPNVREAAQLNPPAPAEAPDLPQQAVEGVIKSAPVVAETVGLGLANIPSWLAAAGPMAVQAWHDTGGDLLATVRAGIVGGFLGPVSKIGGAAGEVLGSKVAAVLPEAAEGAALTAGRVAGSQGGMLGVLLADAAPALVEKAQTDPDGAKKELLGIIGTSIAFELPHLPAHLRETMARDYLPATLRQIDDIVQRRAQPMAIASENPAQPFQPVWQRAADQAARQMVGDPEAGLSTTVPADEQTPVDQMLRTGRRVRQIVGDPQAGLTTAIAQTDEPTAADSLRRTRRSVVGLPVDAETTAFSPESQTLGISREIMPQVAHEDQPQLRKDLKAEGITTSVETVLPGELKPSQAEFTPAKVEAKVDQPSDRPIIVSADNHVVDGHHDYVAALENPTKPVKVLRVDAPAATAIAAVKHVTDPTWEELKVSAEGVNLKKLPTLEEFQSHLTTVSQELQARLKKTGVYVHFQDEPIIHEQGESSAPFTVLSNDGDSAPMKLTTEQQKLVRDIARVEQAKDKFVNLTRDGYHEVMDRWETSFGSDIEAARKWVNELKRIESGGSVALNLETASGNESKTLPASSEAKPVSMAERLQVKPTKPVFTPERQKVFEQMADASPESPLGRLSQWLGNERLGGGATIREIADRKSYQVTGHVDQPMSDEIVHRLTTGALDYWTKHKDFHLGVGGFQAEQAATWAAQNELARPARRAKIDSLDREVEQGRPIGDTVAAPAVDPAAALHAKDLETRRSQIIGPALSDMRGEIEPLQQKAFDQVVADPSGSETKLNKLPHDVRDALTPEFRQQALRQIFERLSADGYDPTEIAQLLRFSVGQTADQPLSTTAMADQVERLIQRLAPKAAVRVSTEQPPILGNRWVKGVTHADGTITLYSRAIHSLAEAREVLVEELGHLAVRDQRLRPLVDRLLATLTPEEVQAMVSRGYDPSVAPEEALQRRVVSADLSAQQRTLWQKIKVLLADAWLKATGRRSSDTDIRDLLRAALKAGKLPGGERSSSVSKFDLPTFKAWFGDSKVVDSSGNPLTVYHGTSSGGFNAFDPYASNYGLMGDGSYFTENPEVASSYTKKGKGDAATVYPVHLSIKNPLDFDAPADLVKWQEAVPDADFKGVKTNEQALRALEEHLAEQEIPKWEGAQAVNEVIRAMGYDGGTHIGGGRFGAKDGLRHRVWIVLDPTQIKSAIGNTGAFDPTNPDLRFSVGNNVFTKKQDLERALDEGAAGDTATIKASARATASLIPEQTTQKIAALEGSSSKADQQAARQLRLVSEIAGVTSDRMAGLKDLTPEQLDTAARAMVDVHGMLEGELQKAEARVADAQEQLREAVKGLPERMTQAELTSTFAKAAMDDLHRGFVDQAEAKAKLYPQTTIGEQQRLAARAAYHELAGVTERNRESVTTALLQLARQMPAHVNTTEDLRNWLHVQQAGGWPAFGGTRPMSDAVFNFLVRGDPANGVLSAIEGAPDIVNRLSRMAKLEADKGVATRAIADYAQTVRDLGGSANKQVTPLQFARTFANQRAAHQEAADDLASMHREFDRVDRNVRSAITSRDALEQMLKDPEYQRRSGEAARLLNQRMRGVLSYGEDPATGRADGTVKFKGPITGLDYTFSLQPDPSVHRESVNDILRWMDEVRQWQGDGTILKSPAQTAAYDTAMEFANRNLISEITSETLSQRAKVWGFVTGEAQASPMLAALQLPFLVISEPIKVLSNAFPGAIDRHNVNRMIGGTAGRMLQQVMTGSDLANEAINRMKADPKASPEAIKRSMLEASKRFRGQGVDANGALIRWSDEVLNSLFATNQNPGGLAFEVGDVNEMGHRITLEDLRAAKTMKRYADGLRDLLSDASNPALRFQRLMTQDELWFRRQTEYGLKMPREYSDFAKDFTTKWLAAKAEDAKTGPTNQNAVAALLSAGSPYARRLVNSFWGTTNPEYWEHYKDKLQARVARELVADRKTVRSFDGIDDFSQFFGRRRAELLNAEAGSPITTIEEQTAHARDRLLQDADQWVAAMRKIPQGGAEPKGLDAEGVGRPIMDVIDAHNSFVEPRGSMIAPDAFYNYTLTEDSRLLRLNAAAHLVFQKFELNRMDVVIGALTKQAEAERLKYKEAIQGTGLSRMMDQRKYNAQRLLELRSGEAVTTLGNIERQLTILKNTRQGVEDNMRAAKLDDLGFLRVARKSESVASVLKLLTPNVQFSNAFAAIVVAPVLNSYNMARGKLAMAAALSTPVKLARDVVGAGILAADRLGRTITRAPLIADIPGWHQLIDLMDRAQRKRLNDLQQFGRNLPETPTWRQIGERWALNTQLASTHGTATREDASKLAQVFNWLMAVPEGGSTVAGEATSKGERFGSFIQDKANRQYLDALRGDAYRLYELRDQTGMIESRPGVLRPIVPSDLGFHSHKQLDNLRRIFGAHGTLEYFLHDFYQRASDGAKEVRTDAAGTTTVWRPGNPLGTPLLRPEWEPHILKAMLAVNNIVTASGKADVMKGKGWKGFVGGSLLRFQQYPAMLSHGIRDVFSQDVRDNDLKTKAMLTTGAYMALATLMAAGVAHLWGKQQLGQVVTGKVPATTTPEQLLNDPSAVNFAKVVTAGGAGLFMPYFGDYLASLLGGQSRRPGLDLMQVVPGLGQIALVTDTAKRIFQTGDAYQPILDLIRRTAPVSEAVLNRLPGQDDLLVGNNAVRSLRSAIPQGLEARRQDSGTAVETPGTPFIRQAVAAAASGNRQQFDQAVAQAVALKVHGGATAADARTAVERSILARDPIRTVYGKDLTSEELQRATSGMTGPQLQAFTAGQSAFARAKAWTSKPRKSGGIFGQSRGLRRKSPLLGASRRRHALRFALS